MAKTDVTTLVDDMGLSDTNSSEISRFYDEIVRELGFQEVLTNQNTVNQTAGTASYNVPANTIEILEVVGSNGTLRRMSKAGAEATFGTGWRELVGSPLGFISQFETEGSFRLVPSPDFDDTLQVLHTEYRQDVPFWLEIPIVFEILFREYIRESDHQDTQFAQACRQVAQLLFTLVAVRGAPRSRKVN